MNNEENKMVKIAEDFEMDPSYIDTEIQDGGMFILKFF
jgi:hypothetical protein